MRRIAILTLSAFILTIATAAAAPDDLIQVRRAISEQNRSWIAAETSISSLSHFEKKAMLGAWEEPVPEEEPLMFGLRDLPTIFTWANKGDQSWMTPIKNQGSCGSCWAFAGCGALETIIKVSENNPALSIDLSEQFMLSCSSGSCSGWYLSSTMNFLQSTGVPDEACLSYQGQDSVPCSAACPDWESRIQKIDSWSWVSSDVSSLKNATFEEPIPVSMDVYEDFYYYSNGVYEHSWGGYLGGHAVVLIGWDDSAQCWEAKNSWGTGWGEGGYFKIRWDDSSFAEFACLMSYSSPTEDSDGDGCSNDIDPEPDLFSADADGDGYGSDCDCDDGDPSIFPGRSEVCFNSIDDNCDGSIDEGCPTCAALPGLDRSNPALWNMASLFCYLFPPVFVFALRRRCRN